MAVTSQSVPAIPAPGAEPGYYAIADGSDDNPSDGDLNAGLSKPRETGTKSCDGFTGSGTNSGDCFGNPAACGPGDWAATNRDGCVPLLTPPRGRSRGW